MAIVDPQMLAPPAPPAVLPTPPVVPSTPQAVPSTPPAVTLVTVPAHPQAALYVYGHANFLYWWPVWAIGYGMALLTLFSDNRVAIGGGEYLIHPSKNLGVIFTFVFFLVILMTNVALRGIYSVVAILAVLLLVVLAAYLDWWHGLLHWLGELNIYMNMGFYVFFSTLIFIVWMLNVFILDRREYWKVTPGQLTHEYVVGGAAKSYDTRGMTFEKTYQDLFRHWILGLGSADLKITAAGGNREAMFIPNVLFADVKVRKIQELMAMHQQELTTPSA
jgi:hypothetical protein